MGKATACPPTKSVLDDGWSARRKSALAHKLSDLILRSRVAASRRMNGNSGASWFETALRASYGCKLICLSCKRNLACMRAANWPDEQITSDFPKSCQP